MSTAPKAKTGHKLPASKNKAGDPAKPYVEYQRLASPKMCPYDDCDDETLYDLALIRHPDGTVGRVVYLPDAPIHKQWMVLYRDGVLLPLHEQVTKGNAVRVGLPQLTQAQGRVIPEDFDLAD